MRQAEAERAATMHARGTVEIVGVPMDLGGSRRGVDMGPSAMRYASLAEKLTEIGYRVRDRGNIRVKDPDEGRATHTYEKFEGVRSRPKAHNVEEIVRACEELARAVEAIAKAGNIPLVLGGDHSIAMGTIAGLDRAGKRAGVIWIDAHGDSNTPESTPSGNVHGMPFAVALGLAGEPFPATLRGTTDGANGVLLAIRDIDAGERDNIKRAGVTALTMADIDRMGMAEAMKKAIAVAGKAPGGIHVSLDMDALDPDEAPGVGTPVRGGLTYREAQLAMEMLAASGKLVSVEIAEVNPILDSGNRTASLAVELVASALGETIL
ncbi:MAG TPA: arginase [Candidatus Limnocylindria bacterium]|nr:arginase [Candidatus Limnocylindria bacterium]